MKILLVYCNSMLDNALPIGLTAVISCLKQAGFQVALFDTTFYRWDSKSAMEIRMENLQFPPCELRYKEGDVYADFRSMVLEFGPDLIGISMVEPTFHFGMKLLESVRDLVKKNGIKVAAGGVHAIYFSESLTDRDLIDYICISEGEEAFVELCRRLEAGADVSDVEGFIVRTGGGMKNNGLRGTVDINELPILDFSLFGDEYLNKPMMGRVLRTISLELSRGCPYSCTYCGNAWLKEMFRGRGRWYRLKSLDKIHREFREYISKYNPEFIYKHSESFLAVGAERVREYMQMYSEFRIPYWVETRPEDITEEKARLLADSGCRRISLGLESGNEEFRIKKLKRNHSNDTIRRSCAILRDHGVSFSMNLIIGFPDETREMIFDGVNLLREVRPDATSIFLFTPYKGNHMRRMCEERGLVPPDFIGGDYFQMDYSLRNNTIGRDEVLGLFRTIPLYVRMPESEYGRIKRAETYDEEGDRMFGALRAEFYEIMGWKQV